MYVLLNCRRLEVAGRELGVDDGHVHASHGGGERADKVLDVHGGRTNVVAIVRVRQGAGDLYPLLKVGTNFQVGKIKKIQLRGWKSNL